MEVEFTDRINPGDRILVTSTGQTGYTKEQTMHGSWVVHLSDDSEHIDRTFSSWDLENINPHVPGTDSDLDERAERCWQEVVKPILERP